MLFLTAMRTITVLLIDDDIRVSQLLKRFLYETTYNVISAESGIKGIEMAQKQKPDIIFCDIMMPEMDGYGVLKEIRSDDRTKDIPFFFLTAKTQTEDFMTGIRAGATGYQAKPTSREELVEAIQGNVL
jgi:CheY-like chemotaxis protein